MTSRRTTSRLKFGVSGPQGGPTAPAGRAKTATVTAAAIAVENASERKILRMGSSSLAHTEPRRGSFVARMPRGAYAGVTAGLPRNGGPAHTAVVACAAGRLHGIPASRTARGVGRW